MPCGSQCTQARRTSTLRRRRCSSPVVQVTEFGPSRAAVAPGQLPGRTTQQLQCHELGCMQDPQHTKAYSHNHSMTLTGAECEACLEHT